MYDVSETTDFMIHISQQEVSNFMPSSERQSYDICDYEWTASEQYYTHFWKDDIQTFSDQQRVSDIMHFLNAV